LQLVPTLSATPLRTLLLCLAGQPVDHVEWTSVVSAANRALVTGIMAERLRGSVPEDVRSFLSDIYRRSIQRNLRLKEQLQETIIALNAVGIQPILLKGAAILNTLGNDYAARILSDLDLMVPASAWADAEHCLSAIGYQAHDPAERGPDGKTFYRTRDVGMIDLHSRTKVRYPGFEYGELVAHCTECRLGPGKAWVPNPTFQSLFLILHDQLQERDYWRGLIDLRHLLDIDALSRSTIGIDWEQLSLHFPAGYSRRALRVQLLTARELFGVQIPKCLYFDWWSRFQFNRRIAQLRWPLLRLPATLLTVVLDPPRQAIARAVRATDIERGNSRRARLRHHCQRATSTVDRLLRRKIPGKL
jgi:Uncharacterised nucleotidyltransferase